MIVIFDTNAYLYLADNKDNETIRRRVNLLRSAEAKYSEPIHALICDTVAQELLSHLKEPMSADDKSRFCASQAMYFHCGDKKNYGLLPQIWVQLAKELVDFDYSRLINNQIYVGRMLFQLSQLSSIEQMTTLNNEFKHNINNIYYTIQETEQQFGILLQYIHDTWLRKNKSISKEQNKINKALLREYVENEYALDIFMASVIIMALQQALYRDCQILLKPTIEMYELIVSQNKIPTEQFRSMIIGLKERSAIPQKGSRLNTIWDTLILFAAGKSIDGERIVLVSGDNKMINAAKNVAEKEKRENKEVISYVEYMQMLQLENLIPDVLKKGNSIV